MIPSVRCVMAIRGWEGNRLVAYDDARPDHVLQPGDRAEGTLTIGNGHTGREVHIGLVWTQLQVDAAFDQDCARFERQLPELGLVLKQGQYDCCFSFLYEFGIGRLKLMLSHGMSHVPEQIMRWVHAFGRPDPIPALVERRKTELEWWNS